MNHRHRRLRSNESIRQLVQETHLSPGQFVVPVFVEEGNNIKKEIKSMPGIYRYSIDRLDEELEELLQLKLNKILLFGIPHQKDEEGSISWSDQGIVQKAIRYIKKKYPEFYVIADVCFCEYTTHGHCGIIVDGQLHNDKTLENLRKQSVSLASNGADMLAPSGMIDNMVSSIRDALDRSGFSHIPIMSYAVKYASAFYGPFRDAAVSSPQFGDRSTYQMNPANAHEAMREAFSDIKQGADIIMVKPALAYLDIIHMLRQNTHLPIAAYQVSGEYAMIKAAAANGWIDEKKAVNETLISIKRSGADIIITYFAKEWTKWFQS